jgi:CRISPR-associated protein Csy3
MTVKIPGTLAFSRSIEPSLFSMWGSQSNLPNAKLLPVNVVVETKRGTIANELKADALAKFAAGGDNSKSPANANPQSVEAAYLPASCDTLVLTGQVAFIPNARAPVLCVDKKSGVGASFISAYKKFDEAFAKTDGWQKLAERYVMNLVNGRIAWRNKVAAHSVFVTLTDTNGNTENFNARLVPMNESLSSAPVQKVQPFIAGAAKALGGGAGTHAYVIAVRLEVKLGEGAVVYPSQEFSSGKDVDGRGQDIGKILASRKTSDGTKQGVIHEQKIGNAIRQIDTWYDSQLGPLQPLAAEPYAPLTTMGTFFRQGKKTTNGNGVEHFYDILGDMDGLTTNVAGSANSPPDRALYFAAVIVRGGVFGSSGE